MATGHIPLAALERNRVNGIFAPTIPICDCKYCGTAYRPKRSDRTNFCSRDCAYAYRRENALPKERGQFSVVRFQHCVECQKLFSTNQPNALYCSRKCTARHFNRQTNGEKPICTCKECGTEFQRPYGDVRRFYCSEDCMAKSVKRSARQARKAKQRSVTVEMFNPISVLIRDNWKCRICGVDTPRVLRGSYAPNAPELDHIIPLSRGGKHSMANTQCACRKCNALKGNRVPLSPSTGEGVFEG